MIEQPLDLNAPRPESPDGCGVTDSYTPTPEEEKLLKYVNKLYSEAKIYREPYVEKWKDYYHDFRGKQWRTKRPSYRHSEVINMIFTAIQNQVPLMTDARPRVEYFATEPQDVELASILNDLFSSDWERNDWNIPLLECIYDAHIYGTGLAQIGFDESLDYGTGGITWNSLEPIYGFPSPGASDINTQRKCRYFVYGEPVDLEEIKARYPEKGKFVKADLRDLWQAAKTDLRDIKYRSPADNRAVIEGHPAEQDMTKNQALVRTVFCRPIDTVEEEHKELGETDEEKTVYITKLKYPNGRKIVVAGNVVLEDGPLDIDDKSIPLQKLANYIDPRSFFGISDIEQLEGPQIIFNKMISFALDVMTLTGNPIWIVDTEAEVDTDNLVNIPGSVIEKSKGAEVRREAGTQLQPYVLQLIDRMKLWFDDISGSQEVSRGANPSGVTAARAIEALQQTGRTRIRQKTRNMDTFLREFGRQYVQFALQNYTVPRIRRVTGKDGSEKYFKFATERPKIGDEQKTIIQYQEFSKDEQGNFIPIKTVDRVLTGEFDVRVNTVSGLPFAKAEAEQKLFALFDRQVIDGEELLKGIDYPNADSVLQRLNERAQAQAQAQAQGQ